MGITLEKRDAHFLMDLCYSFAHSKYDDVTFHNRMASEAMYDSETGTEVAKAISLSARHELMRQTYLKLARSISGAFEDQDLSTHIIVYLPKRDVTLLSSMVKQVWADCHNLQKDILNDAFNPASLESNDQTDAVSNAVLAGDTLTDLHNILVEAVVNARGFQVSKDSNNE